MRLVRSIMTFALSLTLTPALAATVTDLYRTGLEHDLRDGLTADALVRELGAYFPAPKDREFLKSHRPTEKRLKPRAFERVTDGYRLTLPDGRVATLTVTPAGEVLINKYGVPESGAGLRAVFEATAKGLRTTHAAHRWYAIDRADAAPVDLTNGIVMLSVFTVVVMQKSVAKDAKAPRLGDLLKHGLEVCERENFEGLAFEESRTGRMIAQLQSFSTFDFTHESTAESCQAKIKEALVKNNAEEKTLGISPADLMSGCVDAARLTTCVREYRARKGRPDTPFAPALTPAGAAR